MTEQHCRFYGSAAGCRYGNNCKFSHSYPQHIPICKYFKRNQCKFGYRCKFRHLLKAEYPKMKSFDHKSNDTYNKHQQNMSVVMEDDQFEDVKNDTKPMHDVNVSRCGYTQRMIKNMNQCIRHRYQQDDHIVESINISEMLNDYLHLLHLHDDDEALEFISTQLMFCDIIKCDIIIRRNKVNITINQSSIFLHLRRSILDKIHCYYHHCFDMGYRLSQKERNAINITQMELKLDNDESFSSYCNSETLIHTTKILSKKHKVNNSMSNNNRLNQKYNSLFGCKKQNDMYSFGSTFYYGYNGESTHSTATKLVTKKYGSLKEELISNEVARIAISQYELEYEKATLHFNSNYCKQKFIPYNQPLQGKYNVTWRFCFEHVLSLMIYCNYTQLQYEFSKTYRYANGDKHCNFYHLGKYLKIVVGKFGQESNDSGQIVTFYHGISEQLLFSKCEKITIECPCSTSTVFAVALSFTNDNNGIIIQLEQGGNWGWENYFSVAWLSDFGNESEHLFIQQDKANRGISITNIFDVQFGYEYYFVLKAMCIIFEVFDGQLETDNDIPDKLYQIIKHILCHQMSKSISTYKPFKFLSNYAKKLLQTQFNSVSDITLDCDFIKNYVNHFFINEFFYPKLKWIKMDRITALFTKLKTISIYGNFDLCSAIFNDIISQQRLTEIFISIADGQETKVRESINQHVSLLKENKWFISEFLYRPKGLNIKKLNSVELVIELIECLNTNRIFYFEDTNDEIGELTSKLIKGQLSNVDKDEYEQQLFNKYCVSKTRLHIDWQQSKQSRNSQLFELFSHPQLQWLKLHFICSLFPNLTGIFISGVNLCSFIFDDCLKYLQNKSGLQLAIIIDYTGEKDLSASCIVSKYQNQFKKIEYRLQSPDSKQEKKTIRIDNMKPDSFVYYQ
eukprot:517780_1